MSLIKPDFSEVQDNVGPGTYKARIVDGTLGVWMGKEGRPDTQYINWRLETYDEAESKNNGRSIFNKTPISGRGAFKLKEFYKAATRMELGGEFDIADLFGKEVEVTVVDGTTKDGTPTGYTDIKAVRPVK